VGIVWQSMSSLWVRAVMSFLTGAFACPPAKAQSIFETLFGFGASAPKVERASPKRIRVHSLPAVGDGYQRDPAYGGDFKTVCVRTCDGYYWPVSTSVTSARFETDAKRCDQSCLGEAKLYYQHKDSDDPLTLTGLDGTPYTALKSAFLYRKTLINGCGCRPAPWSNAEVARHQTYKAADDAKKVEIAMARVREQAEALRRDKIAQIIAATRDAVRMDDAEEAAFGAAVAVTAQEAPAADPSEVIAAVEVATNPDVSVTGYVHLHVLPNAVIEMESELAEVAAAKASPRSSRTKPARAKTVQTVSLFGELSKLFFPEPGPRRAR
jgi:hypothetical protein